MNNFFIILTFISSFMPCLIFCMNKEIEYKFSLPDDQRIAFQTWLEKNKAAAKPITQHEEYYFEKENTNQFDLNTFRLRKARNLTNNQFKLSSCYKERQKDVRNEYETQLENLDAIKTALLKKFNATMQQITKIRRAYQWNNELEIAFDHVAELGSFIEIEVTKKVDKIEDGLALIHKLLKQAGIQKIVKYDKGYIHMLTNDNAKKGQEFIIE